MQKFSKKIVVLDTKKLDDEIFKFEYLMKKSVHLFMNKKTAEYMGVVTSPLSLDVVERFGGRKVY